MIVRETIRAGPKKEWRKRIRIGAVFSFFCIFLGCIFLFGRFFYHFEAVQAEKELRIPKLSIEQPDTELMKLLRKLFKNKHCVAYLYCPELKTGYQVMQGKDNQFYLNHNPKGRWSVNGSIFLDAENDPKFTDTASVIYGHHMIDGSMFGRLENAYTGVKKNGKPKTFRIYTRTSALAYTCFANTRIHGVDEKVFHVDGEETVPEFFQTLQKRSSMFRDEFIGLADFPGREEKRTAREEELFAGLSEGAGTEGELAAAMQTAKEQIVLEIPEPLYEKRVVTLTTCHRHVDRFGVTGVLTKETDISKLLYPNSE